MQDLLMQLDWVVCPEKQMCCQLRHVTSEFQTSGSQGNRFNVQAPRRRRIAGKQKS